jgi:biotin synthase
MLSTELPLTFEITEKVLCGEKLGREEALGLAMTEGPSVYDLFSSANRIRDYYRKDTVDLCSIMSVRAGGCTEDCSFCAQSSVSRAGIDRFPMKKKEEAGFRADAARQYGAKRFCLVTGGKRLSPRDLAAICDMIPVVKSSGLLPCATLGLLDGGELEALKAAGLHRYHNNLETSGSFFSSICTTHTYKDKVATIVSAKEAGLSVCSGGIFGLGETWEDRVELAMALRDLDVDSVPVNFLTPVKGTLLESKETLNPIEALKIISLFRFLLPQKEIRVCGGRAATLGQLSAFIYMAGADGLLIGDYLTTKGWEPARDLGILDSLGLKYD